MATVTEPEILGDAAHQGLRVAFFVLKRICPVIIVIIGMFGNTVSLLITTRKEYRDISTMVYMSGLAVLDNVFCFEMALSSVFVLNGYELKIPNRRIFTM